MVQIVKTSKILRSLPKASHLLLVFLCLILSGCVRFDWPDPTQMEGSMPLLEEDVLWVSSVPLGASVVIFPKEKGQLFPLDADNGHDITKKMVALQSKSNSEALDQHTTGPFSRPPAGKTPLAVKMPPGIYWVGIQLDIPAEERLADWLCQFMGGLGTSKSAEIYSDTPRGRIGSSSVGIFVDDGNQEEWYLCDCNGIRKAGRTYEIEKKEGETATVIALFQKQDEDPDKAYEMLPEDYNFRDRFLSPGTMEAFHIPKDESKLVFERLMRGGKAIYLDENIRFKCELTPLGKTPDGKHPVGFTMSYGKNR